MWKSRSFDNFLRKHKFADIWKEADGMLSMMRMLNFMLVMVPLTVWTILSLHLWVLVPIPESVLVIMIAALTGKVAQRFLEGKEDHQNNQGPEV